VQPKLPARPPARCSGAAHSLPAPPVRVLGVIDLRFGRAVHARGGRRAAYAPVESPLASGGDARALARAYRDTLGVGGLYVADLDAIEGRAPQRALVGELAAGGTLWLDAAVADPAAARAAAELGAERVIVGLETLPSLAALAPIVVALGAERVAFSLDLRDGRPLARDARDRASHPAALAERAVGEGAGTVIVLDLARVGAGAGLDLALLAEVRRRCGAAELVAGGGVRGPDDLARLAAAGCDGALVASAFHGGALGPGDVHRARAARADDGRPPGDARG
jgi:phosphoribosylformimino-5-aminoimidazole carboxamide ribotide isomerase